MRILPSSNVRRTRGNRRAASRTLLVESLSARVVLSGSGWSELAAGGLEPLRAEAAYDRQEGVAAQQAFAEIAASKTPMEVWSPSAGIVRREAYSDSGFVTPKDSPGGLWRNLAPAHSITQSFPAAAPALYSVNFILGPSVIWTVVVDASVVAAQMGLRDGSPPAHIWDKGPGYDGRLLGGGLTDGLAAPQVSLVATQARDTPVVGGDKYTGWRLTGECDPGILRPHQHRRRCEDGGRIFSGCPDNLGHDAAAGEDVAA